MSVATTAAPLAPSSAFRRILVQYPLAAYFVIAFFVTWILILPMALGQGPNGLGILPFTVPDAGLLVLFILPCFGPAAGAIIVTWAESGKAGVFQLLRRLVQWRVGIGWYLVAIFGALLIWLLGFTAAAGLTPFSNFFGQLPLVLSTFVPLLAFGLVIPSLGEEPGWRGFALPRLQARYGPLLGTLILGTIHGLWHLPSFFTPFAAPFTLGNFLGFVAAIMGASFFWTWIYNNTKGSLLIALLVHSAFNAASGVLNLNAIIPQDLTYAGWVQAIGGGAWLNAVAFGAAGLLVIVLTRGRLSYRPIPPALVPMPEVAPAH